MQSLVKNQKYTQLAGQLRQISPELQAYALTGLLELKNQGVPLQEKELVIIDRLEKRDAPIYHCAGCIYGLTTTVKEIINRD